jgi:predicted dehydrogenase
MHLSPQQKEIGKANYNEAVAFTRRNFLMGAAAAVPGLGAAYFGYEKLKGDRVKVGFIGTGDEGSVLLTQHPEDYMEIVAVADLRPTNLKRAKHGDGNDVRVGLINKLGAETAMKIKEYSDHRELLADPEIEAVVIAVPLVAHAPLALEALKAGKHVLTEKLMAHNITECKEMIKVAREQKKLLAVGHQRHYSVLYDNANDLVQRGLLGDIRFIRAQWHRNNSFPGRDSWRKRIDAADRTSLKDKNLKDYSFEDIEHLVNWRLYNSTGGGLMAELGSHQLDACSIFLGKVKPLAVSGYGGRNFYGVKGVGSKDKQEDDREIDDQVFVTFEFPGRNYDAKDNPNDVVVVTYSSINTNRAEPYGETLFGSRGTMMVEEEQNVMLWKEESPITGPGGLDQRLYILQGSDGKPVLSASESVSKVQAVSATVSGKVSRGYTEEMEHFCHCIRTNNFESPADGGLRCPGEQGMKDAIMALTSNMAMKLKKRIVFKDEWFDPTNPAVPETDEQMKS